MKKRAKRRSLAEKKAARPDVMTMDMKLDSLERLPRLSEGARAYWFALIALAARPGPQPCPRCGADRRRKCPVCSGATRGLHVRASFQGLFLTPEEVGAWMGKLPVEPEEIASRTY
ncbi:MAG TPA: hypothetical protein VJU61_08160 [Polyangiaceae bacterium]|nr:hypothetical protein [Polyangiaceae bacterium]